MDKDSKKKGINLMPEDLRSKESSILSKVKNKAEFDFDFVSPENISGKKQKSEGSSFFVKLKQIFNKPKSFGASTAKPKKTENKEKKEDKSDQKNKNKDNGRPKIVYNPNQKKENKLEEDKELKNALHIPNKEKKKHKDNFHVDYKDGILGDNKKDESKKIKNFEQDSKEKSNKPSFWDKIKGLFTTKAKAPKLPKIEKVPAKPIVAKNIKLEEKKVDKLPELDKDKIKSIPELKSSLEDKPKVPILEKKELEVKTSIEGLQQDRGEEKKGADFSIPAISGIQDSKIPLAKTEKIELKEDKKPAIPKFHQPQTRIRAKLLDNGGGVDLIPAAARTRSWGQIMNLLLTAVLGAAFIVVIFYGFLFYQVKNVELQKNTRSDQITALEKKILDYEELNNDIGQLGAEIKAVHKLLNFHLYWTNFFQLLEKYTVAEVYYSGLAAGNGGAITLNAVGTDFDSVARQIKVLEQEEARELAVSVDVSSAEYSEMDAKIKFDMTLVLNPLLFTYNPDYIYEIEDSSEEEEESEE